MLRVIRSILILLALFGRVLLCESPRTHLLVVLVAHCDPAREAFSSVLRVHGARERARERARHRRVCLGAVGSHSLCCAQSSAAGCCWCQGWCMLSCVCISVAQERGGGLGRSERCARLCRASVCRAERRADGVLQQHCGNKHELSANLFHYSRSQKLWVMKTLA